MLTQNRELLATGATAKLAVAKFQADFDAATAELEGQKNVVEAARLAVEKAHADRDKVRASASAKVNEVTSKAASATAKLTRIDARASSSEIPIASSTRLACGRPASQAAPVDT